MKKIFSFLAVMLIALTASAKVVHITPTSPRSTDNIRYALRDSTTADTIMLAAGEYTEASSITADRNIVIIAAEGAKPVVKLGASAYIKIANGANVVIKGLDFDGFVNETPTVQYAIRPYDASASVIRVENCEFYGFLKNIITSGEDNHADSLIVNNCYFHNNNGRAAVYFPASNVENQQTILGVKITNSTFANNNLANDYVGMIDVRSYGLAATDDIEVIVDHCTFYNNTTKNTDYADVNTRIANRSTVSNCIFAHPEAYDRRATFMYQSSVVTNCITYNLTHDSEQYGHTWMSTRTNCSNADPLFTDAANGDFSLKGNWVTMELSPARGAATDGSDLGDPRWQAAEILPEVSFADPYQFIGPKAVLVGQIGLDANNHIEYYDTSDKGTATWKIHATRACELMATLNMNAASASGHKFKIEVLDENGTSIAEVAEASQTADAGNIELEDHIALPAAGNYIVRLYNLTAWSSAIIEGVTFTEVVTPALPYMAIIGDMNNWLGQELVVAGDGLSASCTINLAMNDNKGYGFKVLVGETSYCIQPGDSWYAFHRGWTSASGIDYAAADNEAFWLSIDKAGDYTFKWTMAEKKLEITFPELENITLYYVNLLDWTNVYAYAWDPEIAAWPGEAATLTDLTCAGHNVWSYTMQENRKHIIFNDGTGGDGHQTADLEWEAGKPYFYDGVWYASLSDVPTAIDNTEAGVKTVKTIENGQLVIIKNGVRYNAQGQVIE